MFSMTMPAQSSYLDERVVRKPARVPVGEAVRADHPKWRYRVAPNCNWRSFTPALALDRDGLVIDPGQERDDVSRRSDVDVAQRRRHAGKSVHPGHGRCLRGSQRVRSAQGHTSQHPWLRPSFLAGISRTDAKAAQRRTRDNRRTVAELRVEREQSGSAAWSRGWSGSAPAIDARIPKTRYKRSLNFQNA